MNSTNSEILRRLGVKAVKELSSFDAVIISGASSGIGEGFAGVLDAVCSPALCNISRSFPSSLKDRKNFLNVPCDLKNHSNQCAESDDEEGGKSSRAADSIKSACDKIFRWLDGDVAAKLSGGKSPKILLINNAGFGAYGVFPSPSVERNLELIDVDVRALTELCGRFMPRILAGSGAIINVGSTAAFQACPQLSAYAAAKSYVKSFSEALSYEMRMRGGKCLCVCPEPTSSKFFSAAGFDSPPLPKWFGHVPEDVAIAAFSALSKGKNVKVVGIINFLQTLFVKFLPTNLVLNVSGAVLGRIRKV